MEGTLDEVALYLNFDMVASPNYIFMVYDGDESGWDAPAGVPIPEGSIQIEDLFESYYTWAGVPYDDAQFSGRSDYQAFIQNGIPAGGLFTGRRGAEDRAAGGDLGRRGGCSSTTRATTSRATTSTTSRSTRSTSTPTRSRRQC